MLPESSYELYQFYDFLGSRLEADSPLSPEESVQAFRAYQEELSRLRDDIRPALEQLDRGNGKEMDFDAVRARVRQQLAGRGMHD